MAITKPTINQCKTRGNQFLEGYRKAAPTKADNGTAHNIGIPNPTLPAARWPSPSRD